MLEEGWRQALLCDEKESLMDSNVVNDDKDEKFRKLQGTYPVIFLSFAGVKQDTYEKTRQVIDKLIVFLYIPQYFMAIVFYYGLIQAWKALLNTNWSLAVSVSKCFSIDSLSVKIENCCQQQIFRLIFFAPMI